jgi:DDE superfamily endonuclease
MEGNVTLNRKGERTISIDKSPSVERASLMIDVSGSGYKFPPFLIFKGLNSENGRINRTFICMIRVQDENFFPDKIIQPINNKPEGTLENYQLAASCTVQKNAYMDTDTILLWLERVYRPWTVTINGPNIIIMHTFAAHKTIVVVDYITDYQRHLIMIPGGYTSKLQVMDVGINKPLKESLWDAYDEWFMNINIRTAKPKLT